MRSISLGSEPGIRREDLLEQLPAGGSDVPVGYGSGVGVGMMGTEALRGRSPARGLLDRSDNQAGRNATASSSEPSDFRSPQPKSARRKLAHGE